MDNALTFTGVFVTLRPAFSIVYWCNFELVERGY